MQQFLGQIVDQGGQVFNVNAYRPSPGSSDQDAVNAALAAIAATPNQSGILYFPPGTFTVNIALPANRAPVHVQGSGIAATRLVSGSPTTPVIYVARGARNGVRGVVASGFTVVPHAQANASTPSLIDLAGFWGSTFRDIAYQQNPKAGPAAGWPLAMFTLSAFRGGFEMPCYGNLLSHIFVQEQPFGPKNVILFENDGTNDVSKNANSNFIEQLWCYSNRNIDFVVDALRSSLVTIRDSEIEDNPTAT
ncbi:MAG TPA: hypothetical protein VFS20_04460, partial [Longimicrobium sp.]|nr:hypothetical protein [Longimicrobium sp.]